MLKPRQRIWSASLRRLVDLLASRMSFGMAVIILVQFLHRSESDSFARTSIESIVWQDGADKAENDREFARSVFKETPWLDEDGLPIEGADIPASIAEPRVSGDGSRLLKNKIDEIISKYNEGRPDEEQIKDKRMIGMIDACPYDSVYAMVDSIIVPHQKEHRNVNGVTGTTRQKKTSSIANAYILSREGTYQFTGKTEEDVMKLVLAYLIHNRLLENRELIFFADGANGIKALAGKYFSFRDFTYHLDWYHLRKKCYEYFSMALKGGKANKERNNKLRYEFFKRLWAGNVDEAIRFIDALEDDVIKSSTMLDAIKDYIGEKKRESIYSYAIHKELHMINSSNRCEKENDIIVGERCKDNSRSWSDDGVLYMSQIRAIFENTRFDGKKMAVDNDWFNTHKTSYEPIKLTEKMATYMYDMAA